MGSNRVPIWAILSFFICINCFGKVPEINGNTTELRTRPVGKPFCAQRRRYYRSTSHRGSVIGKIVIVGAREVKHRMAALQTSTLELLRHHLRRTSCCRCIPSWRFEASCLREEKARRGLGVHLRKNDVRVPENYGRKRPTNALTVFAAVGVPTCDFVDVH
jgi:hypothetical protein